MLKYFIFIVLLILAFVGYRVLYLPLHAVNLTRDAHKLVDSNPEKALKLLLQSKKISPTNAETLVAIGKVCLKMNKPERMNEIYGDLFKIPEIQECKGLSYVVAGNAEIFFLWGQANALLGNKVLAKKAMQKASDIVKNISLMEAPAWEPNLEKQLNEL